MLRANVRPKLLVAFPFEVPRHFFDRVALRRTRIVERPGAFRTTPTSQLRHPRRLDPDQFSHRSLLTRSFARLRNKAGPPSGPSSGNAGGVGGGMPRPVAWRRAFSATARGTCSKRVFPFRIMAASSAAGTVTTFRRYGENLLYVCG